MTDQDSRLARLEQWKADHSVASEQHFQRIDKRLDANDEAHDVLMGTTRQIRDSIRELNTDLVVYRRVIYLVGAALGTVIYVVWTARDWLIHRLGH